MMFRFNSFVLLSIICVVLYISVVNCDTAREPGHYENGEHNKEYDREAFLGEEAKNFDELSPEESRRRVGIIFERIDSDHDGLLSLEELKDWISYTLKKYLRDSVENVWKSHNPDGKDKITWDDYSKQVYGFTKDLDEREWNNEEDGVSYKAVFERDRRRWNAADLDGDDALTKEEISAFLHPEETPHMKDLVVLETLEDTDKDKDGKISLQEYIKDMFKVENEDEEPEWLQREKEQFSLYRDKNGDGFLDIEEVKNWISPQDFDHADVEARHLIHEADANSDKKLSKEEVLDKFDVFVGSQATDYGDILLRHDEF